jgi:hypothetical protein
VAGYSAAATAGELLGGEEAHPATVRMAVITPIIQDLEGVL